MKLEDYRCRYDEDHYIRVEPSKVDNSVVVKMFLEERLVDDNVVLKAEDIPRLIAQLQEAQFPTDRVQLGSDAIKCLKILRRHRGEYGIFISEKMGIEHGATMDILYGLRTADLVNDPYGWNITPEGIVELERAESAPEPVCKADEVPDDIRSVIEATVKASMLGFWNTPSGREPAFDIGEIGDAYARADADRCRETPEAIIGGKQSAPEDTTEVRIAVATCRNPASGKPVYVAYGTDSEEDIKLAAASLPNMVEGKTSWVTARVPLPPKPVVHE